MATEMLQPQPLPPQPNVAGTTDLSDTTTPAQSDDDVVTAVSSKDDLALNQPPIKIALNDEAVDRTPSPRTSADSPNQSRKLRSRAATLSGTKLESPTSQRSASPVSSLISKLTVGRRSSLNEKNSPPMAAISELPQPEHTSPDIDALLSLPDETLPNCVQQTDSTSPDRKSSGRSHSPAAFLSKFSTSLKRASQAQSSDTAIPASMDAGGDVPADSNQVTAATTTEPTIATPTPAQPVPPMTEKAPTEPARESTEIDLTTILRESPDEELADASIDRNLASSPESVSASAGSGSGKKNSAFKDMKNALVSTTGRMFGRRSKSLRRASSLRREHGDQEEPDASAAQSHSADTTTPVSLPAPASATAPVAASPEARTSGTTSSGPRSPSASSSTTATMSTTTTTTTTTTSTAPAPASISLTESHTDMRASGHTSHSSLANSSMAGDSSSDRGPSPPSDVPASVVAPWNLPQTGSGSLDGNTNAAGGMPPSPLRRSNSQFSRTIRKLFSHNAIDKELTGPVSTSSSQGSSTSPTPPPNSMPPSASPSSAAPSAGAPGAGAPSMSTQQSISEPYQPRGSNESTPLRSNVSRSVSVAARTPSARQLIAARNVPRLSVTDMHPAPEASAAGQQTQLESPLPASAPAQFPTHVVPAIVSPSGGPVPPTPVTALAEPQTPVVESSEQAQKQKEEAKRRKRLQVRAYIVEELLATERNYVQNLRIVMDLFVKPLMDAADSDKPIISKVDVKLIFSSIEGLHVVNSGFLADLEDVVKNWSNDSAVGALFNKHFEGSEVYIKFVDSYSAAKAAIRRSEERSPAYRSFVQDLQANPECHRQGISDHLILPIQRVTRYVMLLQDLVKNTEPTHDDYTSLSQALSSMRQLSTDVNEAKRAEESMTQMFHIQKLIAKTPPTLISASRRYVSEYEMVEYSADTLQPFRNVMLFLFTNALMVARASTKNWTSSIRNITQLSAAARPRSYKYDSLVDLKGLIAATINDKDGSDKLLFKITIDVGRAMIFQAASPNDRMLIVAQINENAKALASVPRRQSVVPPPTPSVYSSSTINKPISNKSADSLASASSSAAGDSPVPPPQSTKPQLIVENEQPAAPSSPKPPPQSIKPVLVVPSTAAAAS